MKIVRKQRVLEILLRRQRLTVEETALCFHGLNREYEALHDSSLEKQGEIDAIAMKQRQHLQFGSELDPDRLASVQQFLMMRKEELASLRTQLIEKRQEVAQQQSKLHVESLRQDKLKAKLDELRKNLALESSELEAKRIEEDLLNRPLYRFKDRTADEY